MDLKKKKKTENVRYKPQKGLLNCKGKNMEKTWKECSCLFVLFYSKKMRSHQNALKVER